MFCFTDQKSQGWLISMSEMLLSQLQYYAYLCLFFMISDLFHFVCNNKLFVSLSILRYLDRFETQGKR